MGKTLLVILFVQIFTISYSQNLVVSDQKLSDSSYGTKQEFKAVQGGDLYKSSSAIGFQLDQSFLETTTGVTDCMPLEPMCADGDYGVNVEAPSHNQGAPNGPAYGCLVTRPNPTWYYFRIAEPGTIVFDLSQYTLPNQQGQGIDVDFIVWGPFDTKPCEYTELTADKIVDCSYLPDYIEEVRINNAQQGKYYVLLITNYSGRDGYFNLIPRPNNTGSFDCTIMDDAQRGECDNDGDGQVQFDLNAIAEEIREGDNTLQIKFYSDQQSATNDSNQNIITSPYTISAPVAIFAQVKDASGTIIKIVRINLVIYPRVTGQQNQSAYYCDAGNDGVEIINLTSFNVIPNPQNYTIRYYESLQDAHDGNAGFIPNPTSYQTGTRTVYVRIENENGCYAIAEIFLEVKGLDVDLGDDFSMCEGTFILTASGDFSQFTGVTYTWRRNGIIIDGATTNTLAIFQIGQYSVTVDTAEGCSGSDVLNVTMGEAPVIASLTVGLDNVIVEAVGGELPYKYSLTGVVWQDSNQFDYLQPGTYTVYVKTAEGCVTTAQFVIFQIPTMFTPNGDGINDTWRIPGFDIYPDSSITIYDRQGRMVHQAKITSDVIWDGFFMNGQKAPTQDYWYIINVSDGRKFTGHVTVKSRGEKN